MFRPCAPHPGLLCSPACTLTTLVNRWPEVFHPWLEVSLRTHFHPLGLCVVPKFNWRPGSEPKANAWILEGTGICYTHGWKVRVYPNNLHVQYTVSYKETWCLISFMQYFNYFQGNHLSYFFTYTLLYCYIGGILAFAMRHTCQQAGALTHTMECTIPKCGIGQSTAPPLLSAMTGLTTMYQTGG